MRERKYKVTEYKEGGENSYLCDTLRQLKAAFGVSFKELKTAIKTGERIRSPHGNEILITAYEKA